MPLHTDPQVCAPRVHSDDGMRQDAPKRFAESENRYHFAFLFQEALPLFFLLLMQRCSETIRIVGPQVLWQENVRGMLGLGFQTAPLASPSELAPPFPLSKWTILVVWISS